MAAYCSNPLRSGVDFHTNEVIDAMDVLSLQALERVSGGPPAAYDPPGGFPEADSGGRMPTEKTP